MPVRREGLKPLIYAAGLLPAAVYVYLGIADRLGADDVAFCEGAEAGAGSSAALAAATRLPVEPPSTVPT